MRLLDGRIDKYGLRSEFLRRIRSIKSPVFPRPKCSPAARLESIRPRRRNEPPAGKLGPTADNRVLCHFDRSKGIARLRYLLFSRLLLGPPRISRPLEKGASR